mmetsp:Transcript_36658/g.103407  ORF Transcript_36658/g.103407 Transcript_36658/m.103407 type:complete len:234 (-) Transcript_36658:781-1482(-)
MRCGQSASRRKLSGPSSNDSPRATASFLTARCSSLMVLSLPLLRASWMSDNAWTRRCSNVSPANQSVPSSAPSPPSESPSSASSPSSSPLPSSSSSSSSPSSSSSSPSSPSPRRLAAFSSSHEAWNGTPVSSMVMHGSAVRVASHTTPLAIGGSHCTKACSRGDDATPTRKRPRQSSAAMVETSSNAMPSRRREYTTLPTLRSLVGNFMVRRRGHDAGSSASAETKGCFSQDC